MIIYFCSTTFENNGNGPSKFVKLINKLNDRENVELHIFSEDLSQNSIPNFHNVKVKKGFIWNKIGMVSRIDDYYNALKQQINLCRPDIIVFNNAIIGIRAYNLDIPCLGMINDYSTVEIGLKSEGFSYKYFRHRIFKYFEKKAAKRATAIISNSNYLTDKLVAGYNIPRSKIERLYKSVSLECIPNTKSFKNQETIDILFVKSDFKRGGLKELIQSSNIINKKITLHIVGPKEIDFDRIRALNKNENTTLNFHGRLSQAEVFSLLREVDLFCTPSHSEALGVANMEAMVHRVPVVYTNIGGIKEVMNNGKNGFPCLPKNAKTLANAILRCINDETERLIRINNAEIFVKENFSKNRMLESFINILEKYINVK